MVFDPLSPIAPARVKVLLLPLGQIKRERFLAFIARLYPENVVRLGDISPDRRPNRNMFSPLAFPAGMIVYDLTTTQPPASHLALAPFELYREPLVILAIADGSELSSPSHRSGTANGPNDYQAHLRQIRNLDQDLDYVRDQYPKALLHQAFVFDYRDEDTSFKLPDEFVPVPSEAESTITTMKTLMCDLSSLVLAEMTTMAKSFQGMTSIDSPSKALGAIQNPGYPPENGGSRGPSRRASQFAPSTESRTGSPFQAGESDRPRSRMPMPFRFGSQHGEPFRTGSDSRPATPSSPPLSPVDDASSTKSPPQPARPNSIVERIQEQSRERLSLHGFGSSSPSERSRNKLKGRIAVTIGGLFLQSGRWQDAVKELGEGATIAKVNNDHLWHAKSLEGILVAVLMLAWAGLDFQIPQICYLSADKSASTGSTADQQKAGVSNRLVSLQNLMALLPELLDRILNLYERASHFSGESLPQLPYSETAIRFGKLLSAAHLAGGMLDDDSLEFLVMGTPFPESPVVYTPRLNIQPSRNTVVSTLFRAFPSSTSAAELSIIDRTVILAGIASVLGVLGYDRKKTMVMRELVSVLIPGLVRARMAGAAEVGVHPAAGLAALSQPSGNTNGAGALDLGEGDIEAGMDDLLGMIGRTYGVVGFQSRTNAGEQRSKLGFDDSDEAVVARIMENAAARQFGSRYLKMNILRACINLAEALPDFQGVLRFSADLLRTVGTGIAPGARTDDVSPLMTREEQVRLATTITRTVDAARLIGLRELEAEYWDEFLIRGVELEPLALTRTPNPHRSSELGKSVEGTETGKNPFIYNPFAKKADASAAAERLLVSGESAVFKVTLQNPYEFDIVIERIRLEADKTEFASAVQETVIGPYRTQILGVMGTPEVEGPYKITGCIVKVRGCRERRFPIFSEPWAPEADIKVKAIGLAATRRRDTRPVSDLSMSKRPSVKQNLPKYTTLPFTSIIRQPILAVTSNTLSQAAVMVLEGERYTFSVTLKNLSSTTPVDLLLFSFQDSTQGPIQAALRNRDASPAELYEYELILTRKAALRHVKRGDEDEAYIPPNGEKIYDFEILGKPGLTRTNVLINYAYLGRPTSEVEGNFHTRQVSLPLTVTVNASIELARLDALPLGGDVPSHLWPPKQEGGDAVDDIDPRDYCLLVLDLRNVWPTPLRVRLDVCEGRVIEEDILPGVTSRIMFPQKRIFLPDPYKAIPALDPSRQRQFVVSSSQLSADAERASREAFWYREELLKSLRGTWTTTSGTQRKGDIELRGMRLVPRIIEAIKIEDVIVSLRVEGAPESRRPRTDVAIDDFLHIVVTITNRTAQPIYPLLRLQPSLRNHGQAHPLDLSKKMVWDGTLQRTLAVLGAHASVDVRVTMTALCEGEFEIGASVEETRLWGEQAEREDYGSREKVGRQRASTGAMMDALLGAKERRVWYAREVLVLAVRDEDSD